MTTGSTLFYLLVIYKLKYTHLLNEGGNEEKEEEEDKRNTQIVVVVGVVFNFVQTSVFLIPLFQMKNVNKCAKICSLHYTTGLKLGVHTCAM